VNAGFFYASFIMSRSGTDTDVILIGGGIMSATLGIILKELDASLRITIYEKLPQVAEESSDGWNNAGTGHSAFCELNYTPELPDGKIDISKAVKIADAFETSREFWSYLVEKKHIDSPEQFIHPIPHMSCVWGDKNTAFLKKRHAAMVTHPLFCDMLFSDDPEQLKEWIPLVMKGRDNNQKIAATRMPEGTDVNFGALTRLLIKKLTGMGVELCCGHDVRKIRRKRGAWEVVVKDSNGNKRNAIAPFVFIGAGGGALPLLEKSGIREGRGFGGFPVSGQWLICKNRAVIAQHHAKVYGKAGVGAPPMSVPHLDTRMIGGKSQLLFGPYAAFTTKFLKRGSPFDLFKSIRLNNIIPMIAAGLHNFPLTKYLVKQVTQSPADRIAALSAFVPTARAEDWHLQDAGQRVQIIKKDAREGGVLEFGTELVTSADGTIAALLGASPGASVAPSIMIGLLEKCFPDRMKTSGWQSKLKEMVPSHGMSTKQRRAYYAASRMRTDAILHIGKFAHQAPG
jgi:malate dehydrogenase (quinone)